ncbi:unnamed protein product [Phytomonas sp. Hart1]|nr:unnamed protein product [Phytomonas sp. Hart1]|eukprot:CCW68685.1 unnamed protein product [Phytomonas sp. isolate Hart1]
MPPKENKIKRASSRPSSLGTATLTDLSRKQNSSPQRRSLVTTNLKPSSKKKVNRPTEGNRTNSSSGSSKELPFSFPPKEGKERNRSEQTPKEVDGISGGDDQNPSRPRALETLTDRLTKSLAGLQNNLDGMKERIKVLEEQKNVVESVGWSVNASKEKWSQNHDLTRIRQERVQLENEIEKTNRTIQNLLALSDRLEEIHQHQLKNLTSSRQKLELEIKNLELEKQMNASIIREGFVKRIHLLHRYWPWRQLVELGSTNVGATFEEELKRGPRYRHVGVQNNIRIDYLGQHIKWLETLKSSENAFQNRIWQLEKFVEDLYDINSMIEDSLSCKVCGLLYDEPVIFWPCGHSFCYDCFGSLAIAPSLYRCSVCGSIDSEGFLHNLLLADTVAKWMFKDLGFNSIQTPLSGVRIHLSRLQRFNTDTKLAKLKELLKQQFLKTSKNGASDNDSITISYRMY